MGLPKKISKPIPMKATLISFYRGDTGMNYGTQRMVNTHSTSSGDNFFHRMVTIPKAELENLRRHMFEWEGDRMAPPTTPAPTSSFASSQSSTHVTALHVSSTTSSSWIIDSGASDHMIGLSSLFSLYFVSSSCDKVCVADGTLSSIFGK